MEAKLQMVEQIAESCFGVDGTTKEDFDYLFRKRHLPETRPQKCLSACMHEQFETVSDLHPTTSFITQNVKIFQIKDGKFCRETFVALAKGVANDEKKNVVIEDIGAQCEKVVDPDRCELAGKLVICYKETAEKHGFDFHKLQNGEYNIE